MDDLPVDERARSVTRRILGGDQASLEALVAALADGDRGLAERRRGQLDALFAAVRALALDAGYLDPPRRLPFWAAFAPEQGRDVMKALGSLGYRVDGRGGWEDERVPTRRDLSIAVGYAGVDPVRIRTWPTPDELAGLAGQVVIAGADFLELVAPGLTLAEVSAVVDSVEDAPDLSELWADWDRVRPLLLADA
jgi:hypothetical protein